MARDAFLANEDVVTSDATSVIALVMAFFEDMDAVDAADGKGPRIGPFNLVSIAVNGRIFPLVVLKAHVASDPEV